MPIVSKSVLVPYTPAEMFDLVDDVEKYQDFLPWCQHSKVLERNEEEVRATLDIGFEGIHRSFTTANERLPRERINMRLVEGPFRYLNGHWKFDPKDKHSCEISLKLEFEFANKIIGLAFGRIFHNALDSLVEAFQKRAIEVYGERQAH